MCRLSGISYFRDDPRSFDDRKDITLLDDNVFLVIVDLDFRAGIFGIDDLIAGLDFHLDFLAVNHAAGRTMPDLVVVSASRCFNTTLSPKGTNFMIKPLFLIGAPGFLSRMIPDHILNMLLALIRLEC